jgi:Leucine-rich repeat (LRR) protein
MKRYSILLFLSIFPFTIKSADADGPRDKDLPCDTNLWADEEIGGYEAYMTRHWKKAGEFIVDIDASNQHIDKIFEVSCENPCSLTLNNVTIPGKPRGEEKPLDTLYVDTIARLPHLRVLALRHNAFTHIPASLYHNDFTPIRLQILDLSFNKIEEILPGTFNKLPELLWVLLRGNKGLKEVPDDSFEKNKKLVFVDVRGTALGETDGFDPEVFKKQSGLKMGTDELDSELCRIGWKSSPSDSPSGSRPQSESSDDRDSQ